MFIHKEFLQFIKHIEDANILALEKYNIDKQLICELAARVSKDPAKILKHFKIRDGTHVYLPLIKRGFIRPELIIPDNIETMAYSELHAHITSHLKLEYSSYNRFWDILVMANKIPHNAIYRHFPNGDLVYNSCIAKILRCIIKQNNLHLLDKIGEIITYDNSAANLVIMDLLGIVTNYYEIPQPVVTMDIVRFMERYKVDHYLYKYKLQVYHNIEAASYLYKYFDTDYFEIWPEVDDDTDDVTNDELYYEMYFLFTLGIQGTTGHIIELVKNKLIEMPFEEYPFYNRPGDIYDYEELIRMSIPVSFIMYSTLIRESNYYMNYYVEYTITGTILSKNPVIHHHFEKLKRGYRQHAACVIQRAVRKYITYI